MMDVHVRESKARTHRALIAILAVTAFSALFAGVASAAAQHWYVGGNLVQSPTEVAGTNSGALKIWMSWGGVNIGARCSNAVTGGVIANGEDGASLTQGSLSLAECVSLIQPGACIIGTNGKPGAGRLVFNPLRSSGPLEGGIAYSPDVGGTLIEMLVYGASCPAAVKGDKQFVGSIRAISVSGLPGTYEFSSTSGSSFSAGGQAGNIEGRFTLRSESGEAVTLGP